MMQALIIIIITVCYVHSGALHEYAELSSFIFMELNVARHIVDICILSSINRFVYVHTHIYLKPINPLAKIL